MGGADDFHWVTNAEPHHSRRRAILDKYGDQVRALYGYDHSTAVQVCLALGSWKPWTQRDSPFWEPGT